MKLYLLLMLPLLLACQSEKRKGKTSTPIVIDAKQNFKSEHHLFLNYYFGMTIADYENATRESFITHQVFLGGDRETCTLKRYVEGETSAHVVETINRHSLVFHSFEKKEGGFEALIHPVFKFNRLVKIELHTLHCYNFGTHENDFYRRKVSETQAALLQRHLQDFGPYSVSHHTPTYSEAAVIKNANADITQFDLKKYTFSHGAKVITVQQKCCDFKPVVGYTLRDYVRYQQDKSTENELALEARLIDSQQESN